MNREKVHWIKSFARVVEAFQHVSESKGRLLYKTEIHNIGVEICMCTSFTSYPTVIPNMERNLNEGRDYVQVSIFR